MQPTPRRCGVWPRLWCAWVFGLPCRRPTPPGSWRRWVSERICQRERFAPLPALALWLASLGEGCWQSFLQAGAQGLRIRPDFLCFPSILLVSIVPGTLILVMIRHGAPIAPVSTSALAALAAAALGATGLRLFHEQDASAMILVWQFGSVALLACLGALAGRKILPWPLPGAAVLAQTSRPDTYRN